jgi:hypothetical protein
MRYINLLCLLMGALITSSSYAQQPVNVQDSLALVDLYDSTNGPGWSNSDGWKQGPVNTWYGVVVTGGRVTELNLFANNLLGSVPESFANLMNLQTLYLYNNQLTSLPESFGILRNMIYLLLGDNRLSSLPESFGNLTNLSSLGVSGNQLSSLPESFGNLLNLRDVDLYNNQLSSLPESFVNLTNLTDLILTSNQLTSLPESFGNLTNLGYLNLYNNQLSFLPESFGKLTKLNYLYLDNNHLTSISESFSNFRILSYLSLSSNQLSSIPESFGNLTSLDYLYLGNNQLTSLPESIGKFTNLKWLSLDNNQLSSLPKSFENLISSFNSSGQLYLNDNKFTFGELEWILKAFPSTASIIYAPQNTFKLTQKDNAFIASVGGTLENNTFYWYRDDILESTIQGDSTYSATIAGNYRVEVTNAFTTELRLLSDVVAFGAGNISLTCPPDTTVESDRNGCTATVRGIDPMVTGATIADVMYSLSGATTLTGTGTASGQSFNKGVTTVTYSSKSDAAVNCTFNVLVEDIEAPVITNVSATPSVLWPANHKMQEVVVSYSFWDNCGSTIVLSVSGNDGATNDDWQVVDADHVRLRAERSGSGEERSYVIAITATDASGNKSSQSVNVVVPHDRSKKLPNDLQVLVLPNPSRSDFTIRVQSSSPLPVVVRVSNAVGKTIETIQNTTTKGSLRLGSNYPVGAYYADVIQGNSRAVVKLLKLAR